MRPQGGLAFRDLAVVCLAGACAVGGLVGALAVLGLRSSRGSAVCQSPPAQMPQPAEPTRPRIKRTRKRHRTYRIGTLAQFEAHAGNGVEAKPDRIEEVLDRFPDRVFAFDEFGPLGICATAGSGWARQKHPDRVPATFHRTHGVCCFHGCHSIGDDRLCGASKAAGRVPQTHWPR
uniref:Shy26 n=1 Tax=Streptomyces hygroscopicus subsp. yingchengensis TaxID=228732 RepID=Q67G10_STRHY|nr:Shy26 [Streptomyces hygroscopicus subsp. yingchengensis]